MFGSFTLAIVAGNTVKLVPVLLGGLALWLAGLGFGVAVGREEIR